MAALIALCLAAFAAKPVEQAQMAELERLRAEIASEVHLATFDLLDELVYRWTQDAVFEKPTPVVLAGVSVPVGLGTGLQAMVENHLSNVLIHNPTTNIKLVHCPTCTSTLVQSGPEGTIVSRGIDNPKVLGELTDLTGKHALFVDVEAEGTFLVLRARITGLSDDLPVIWSNTLASSTSTPALLRDGTNLKSADEAREEYLAALKGRAIFQIPVRAGVRLYARPDSSNGASPPPFLWVSTGVELAATRARKWTAEIVLGYSFIPQAYQGILLQARLKHLLTGRTRSLNRPDLYLFAGTAAITVWGQATASFLQQPVTADDIIRGLVPENPRATFGTLHLGVELRVGRRIGVSTFLETMPDYNFSENMGSYIRPLGLGFQSWGTEIAFWF